MYHFCTYFDKHYLTRGLALYRSLSRHAEPFMLHVLCLDDFTYRAISATNEPNLLPISLQEFEDGDEALLEAKKNRTRVEYYFTCTPSLPLYLLQRFPDIDTVTYLDADLFFYSNPAPIYQELGEQSVLIVGHRLPQRLKHLEKHGVYNVGLLVFRNDTYGKQCLRWWRERCLEWCYDRVEDGRFADQKYLDDWPVRFPRVGVLGHKGAGLALWNLSEYDIRMYHGSVLVDSDPLIFYHFHRLKTIAPFLFDPGLESCSYKPSLSSTVRRHVYLPYLRELQAQGRRMGWHAPGSVRYGPSYDNWLKVRAIHKRMLMTIGPFIVQVHLEPVFRPVLHVRAMIFRGLRKLRTDGGI